MALYDKFETLHWPFLAVMHTSHMKSGFTAVKAEAIYINYVVFNEKNPHS